MTGRPQKDEPSERWRRARHEARVVAWAIDALALMLLAPVFVAIGGLVVLLQSDWLADDPSQTAWNWGYAVTGLWLFVPLVYFGVGAWAGGTLGARMLRLCVLDAEGERPSLARATWRAALMYPSIGFAGVGVVPILRYRTGKVTHDFLSQTGVYERAEGGG